MSGYTITPRGDVVLVLSALEARGLLSCAGEGAEGLFADKLSARDSIGDKRAQDAARRALGSLMGACGALTRAGR